MDRYKFKSVTASILTDRQRRNGIETTGPTPGGVLEQALAARGSRRNSSVAVPAPGGVIDQALATRRNRQQRSVTCSKDFLRQAALYAGAFLACYASTIVAHLMRIGGLERPFGLVLVNRTIMPLQGCLNILIYTRPHVNNARQVDRNLTYFQALKQVILSGCDDDQENQSRQSRRRPTAASGNIIRCKCNGPSHQNVALNQMQDNDGGARLSTRLSSIVKKTNVRSSNTNEDIAANDTDMNMHGNVEARIKVVHKDTSDEELACLEDDKEESCLEDDKEESCA